MEHDLQFTLEDAACNPLFFVPIVDFTKLKEKSIVDRF